MPSAAELQVVVGADVSQAESKLSSFGSGLGSALGVGVAAAGAAIAAGVAVGVKAAGDLQQSVANISTIKPEIDTSAVFASLNEMSTRIPQTASQLGESLYNVFSSVNVSAEQGLQLVETFAKGAVGAGTSAETFGTAAMGVMNAFGLSVDDAAHVSDVFFNTIKSGVVTGDELAASLGPVAQSAKAAGVSVDEMGALIVGVTKEGGPAAQNINNLNNLLQKITTKPAQEAMTDLGVVTTTATGAFRPTIEVMRDLKERLGGMTESARAAALQSIFPDAQARLGAQTIMSQIDAVDAALAENKAATGSAAAAYTTMSATFNSQSKLLQNGLMAVLTTVGAMVLPAITPLITAFAQALPAAFETTKAAVSGVFAAFSGGGTGALMNVGEALGLDPSMTSAIADGIRQIGDAWRTVMAIMSGGEWSPSAVVDPFVNAVGMIALAVRDQVLPAFSAFMEAAGQVGAFLAAHTEIIVGVVAAFATFAILTTVVGWVTGLIAAFSAAGAAITASGGVIAAVVAVLGGPVTLIIAAIALAVGLLAAAWATNFMGIQEITFSAMAAISAAISTGLAAIAGFWATHGEAIMAAATAAWEMVTTAVSTAIEVIGMVITAGAALWDAGLAGVWATITTTVQTALDAIGAAIQVAWDTVTTTISTAMTTILTAVQTGWQAVVDFITGILASIQAAILLVWNQIPLDIQADLILITSFLVAAGAEWLASLVASTAAMLLAITTWAMDTLLAITTWGTGVLLQFTTTATTAGTTITAMCAALLLAITTWITTTVAAIVVWAVDFLAPITALIATATAAAVAIGDGILTSIQTKVTEALAAVTTFASDVLAALRGLASSAGAAAAAIGSAIVSGLRGAILAGAQSIASAAADVVRKALDAAKSAIGAKSPSRLFRDEVGLMMGKGIELGLTDSMGGITRAMSDAVGFTPPPASSMSSPALVGAGGAGGVVVNLYIEGSVKSERDLVDAVRSGLIEIGRRNGGADVLFSD